MEGSSEQLSHQNLIDQVYSLLPEPVRNQTSRQMLQTGLESRLSLIKQYNNENPKLVPIPESLAAEWVLASMLANTSVDPRIVSDLPLNPEKLRLSGFDQVRIALLIVLEKAYPKGIEYNAPNITLSLDETERKSLEQILKMVPAYKENSQTVLESLMLKLGLKKNPIAGNYVNRLSQQGFQQLIREILFTSSSTPGK